MKIRHGSITFKGKRGVYPMAIGCQGGEGWYPQDCNYIWDGAGGQHILWLMADFPV